METDKGAPGKAGGHGQFYRLLTKVMVSLLTQKDLVEDMTKLVGSDHTDEIGELTPGTRTDLSSFWARSRDHQQILQVLPS